MFITFLSSTKQLYHITCNNARYFFEKSCNYYAESSLSRYENGITESIKAEVLKGISEILGLNLVEMYKLAGLLSEKEDDVRILGLNKREKAQRQKFLEDNAVFFFNDENVSEEDKDKLMLALNNAYFRSKEIKRDKKNKK